MNEDKALWDRLRAVAGVTDGQTTSQADAPEALKPPGPEPYFLEEDLAAAAEVALRLRHPLLLTGDPGTGKTRFAFALAHHLRLPLVRCNIRSNTTVADLYYAVDDVGRFRDLQSGERLPIEQYFTFNGLGRAILFAGGPSGALEPISSRLERASQKPGEGGTLANGSTTFARLYPSKEFPAGRRVIVLLDEFDKAPRDTPNDMLNELEHMRFDVPELGVRVSAPIEHRPIVIITSNSERSLPDPFLRRCIYYDIQFPKDPKRLRQIAWNHLKAYRDLGNSPLLDDAVGIFVDIRELSKLTRKPGTAELLDWLRVLDGAPFDKKVSLKDTVGANAAARVRFRQLLSTVIKARDDQQAIVDVAVKYLGVPLPER